MDLLQHARGLYEGGRMHDALEAAQAACDRSPRDAEAWWLLGRIARHTGMPAASDDAFRRAAALARKHALPHRVSADRFQALVLDARRSLSPDARRRLEKATVRLQPLPAHQAVREGLDPDALARRDREPADVLTLYQVNHENRSGSESALKALVTRSLSRA